MSDGFLYLSSYGFGDRIQELAPPHADSRAGVVFNSRDIWPDTRLRNYDTEVAPLRDLGWHVEELDLRQTFNLPENMDSILARFGLVWAVGGNAFVLAQAMDRSGFGAIIRTHISRGMIYGGYSAGACVTGPDLKGIDLMDDPSIFPDGYDAAWSPRTLELTPERIVPHWRSDHPEAHLAERAAKWLARQRLSYRTLRDGDVIVTELGIS